MSGMKEVVVVTPAPELSRYVSFLLAHAGTPFHVSTARNEVEGFVKAVSVRADWVVIDDDVPCMGPADLRVILAEQPETKRAKVLLLTGEDPGRAAASSHLRRSDRVLAKPFGTGDFREAMLSFPRLRRWGRGALAWLAAQARARLDFERYTTAQAVAAAGLVAALTGAACLAGTRGVSGPTLILWGGLFLVVSLAAHLRDRNLRWEMLLFGKFAFLVSLLPAGAIQTAQQALNQAA